MGYKKKQFLSIGLIVFFMILLMVIILILATVMRANMLEIVTERYQKVHQATEIRRLFDQTDRQLLRILAENEQYDPATVNEFLTINRDIIQSGLIDLQGSASATDTKILVQQMEKSYYAYLEMENTFIRELQSGGTADLQLLYEKERSNRDYLYQKLAEYIAYQEKLMNEALKSATDTYNQLIVIITASVLAALILIVIVTIWLSRSMSKNINIITRGLSGLDSGDLTTIPRIALNTKDEFGVIARTFNTIASSLESYSLKEQQYISEITEQNWIQSNAADIVLLCSHHIVITSLAEELTSQLVHVTEASYGIFYLKDKNDDNVFQRVASYAGGEEKAGRDCFNQGEGLIGQCVIDKKVTIINKIPESFQVISTGLGDVRPNSIIIAPVLAEDRVIAVIELASLNIFTSMHVKLFEEILGTLGIAITNILGRMEINRLLQESQTQTEELQMQSEELQAQSEEMQTQSEELRMINEQLEERSREAELKTEELQAAKEDLEKKAKELLMSSKYKSEFLANMSHELRTPLNSILLLSEMLIEDQNRELSKEQAEFAKVIHTAGQELLNLINDILDLSKVEAGKLEIQFHEVNISEFTNRIQRQFAQLAKNKGLEFVVSADKNIPQVIYTDEQRLQQIIKNLLSNAFKFTEAGSVSFTIERADSQELSYLPLSSHTDLWLKLVVSDTGIGIAEDKQQEIFEAFQQIDGDTMRKYGGTGLGLSITREFTGLLGGVCNVKSQLGSGSSFTVFIPSLPYGLQSIEDSETNRQTAAVKEIENQSKTSKDEMKNDTKKLASVLAGKTVLVVDDDYRNIYALKNTLEKEGMNVLTAENGMESLQIIEKENKIDIILMDIMMPVLDGYETIRRIRLISEYREIPIIALTAKAMSGDRQKCIEAGASDYISKPLKIDQLLSAIRVWLS